MRSLYIALAVIVTIITHPEIKAETTTIAPSAPSQNIIIQTNIKTTEDAHNETIVKNHTVQKPIHFMIKSRLATEMIPTDNTKPENKDKIFNK